MSFAVPLAFALTALALPIIGFYILKVRLRRIPTSTNLFWKQMFAEKPPRSLWENFRHLLSLLLQLLMLLLLVFAIADPFFSWQILQSRRLVLVIDNSASMRANDVAPSRFDAARNKALDIVNSLRFRDELAIVLAGKLPEVVLGMTNHAPTLRRALEGLSVSDGPTELKAAIMLGEQLLGNHPHGQVIVLTDGCVVSKRDVTTEDPSARPALKEENSLSNSPDESSRAESPLGENHSNPQVSDVAPSKETPARIVYELFGSAANNVGITQFQVRRSLVDPIGYEALISIKNASAKAVQCRLELTLDETPIDVIPLKLQPEEAWSRSIEKTSLEGGRLVAMLTQIQALEAKDMPTSDDKKPDTLLNVLLTDDTAWAILPDRKIQKTLIVSPGNLFLQKVFEANPLVKVTLSKEFPTEWPSDSLIVLHQQVPAELPKGNVFVIDPTGPCNEWEIGKMLENPIVTEQDLRSSLMTHCQLDNVLMPEAKQLAFKSPTHVLAGVVTGEAVYSEVKRANGKCLVLSVNLEASDLAFRTAFPIMVTNALGWFAGTKGELNESLPTGATSRVAFDLNDRVTHSEDASNSSEVRSDSSGASNLSLRNPSGFERPFQPIASDDASSPSDPDQQAVQESLSTTSVSGQIGPLNEVGVWSIGLSQESTKGESEVDDEALYEVAVNLANSQESDLRPNEELSQASKERGEIAGWFGRPIWFYLVLLACVLTSTEWYLHQRRVIT